MKSFLIELYKSKAHLIFGSTIFSRIIVIINSILIVRIISKVEFGNYTYANTIIALILPFVGLGLSQSLLRYGAISQSFTKRHHLFLYSLKYGFIGNAFIISLLFIASKFLTHNLPNSNIYLSILAFSVITRYFILLTNSYLRVFRLNKAFAKVDLINYFFLATFSILLSFLFGGKGYAFAQVISPVLLFTYLFRKKIRRLINDAYKVKFNFSKNKAYIKYGLFIGLGSMASQLVLVTDQLLIGNLIKDANELAVYKIGVIIPLGLLFVPSVILTTDFVKIAQNSTSKKFLSNYVINYFKFITPIVLITIPPLYIFSDWIIINIFGPEYIDAVEIFRVLLIGIAGVFFFRSLFGNILNAVGKAKWNVYNAYFLLIFNTLVSYALVSKYGIIGAAYATTILYWISGLISSILFLYYLKTIKNA